MLSKFNTRRKDVREKKTQFNISHDLMTPKIGRQKNTTKTNFCFSMKISCSIKSASSKRENENVTQHKKSY